MKTYYIQINDELDGLQAISFVQNPAIEVPCLKFEKEVVMKFDDDRHIITGPSLIPDMPIYRNNGIEEFNVVFTADVIKKLVIKYSKDKLLNAFDLEHKTEITEDKAIMFESYFIDKERGICPAEFDALPDGTWMTSYFVEDKATWDYIKNSGMGAGFSVEVVAGLTEKLSE